MVRGSVPDAIVQAWSRRVFVLLTCDEQLDELRECFARPWLVPERIRRHEAGRLINHMRRYAVFLNALLAVTRSADPDDDYLLALAEMGRADYLVTGDKAGLLRLLTHRGTRIVRAREFVASLRN